MLLRAILVMLVMLNLGAALWWLGGARAPTSPVAVAPADAPALRLLHEAVPLPVGRPPSPAPGLAPNPSAATAPAAAAAAPVEPAAPAAAPVCLRFGPFADAAGSDAARAALTDAGVQAIPRQSTARAARGWKVATSPFASREEALAMAERLRAAGVTDLYVMGEGPDANRVALGRYGSEDAARRRQADLRGKGFEALAEPLGGGPVQAWLDARLPPGVEPASLGRIAASRPVDCATLR